MDRFWRSNSSISSKTGCPLDIVNKEDHNVKKHGASILMYLRNVRFKNFKDNIFGMINNDLVYSNYPKASSPYSRTANEEEDDCKSVCLPNSNFPPIDNSDYVKQLRVLTVLNESFEVDLVPLYDEFMLSDDTRKNYNSLLVHEGSS